MMRSATDARDVVVTGMGFCLPGLGQAAITTAGRLGDRLPGQDRDLLPAEDGVYYGSVDLPAEKFAEYFPEIPGIFAAHFTDTHRFGLMSFLEACTDAKLDVRAGALTNAGILVGRGGVDANIAGYLKVLNTEIGDLNILEATSLFIESSIAVTSSDVALAQSAFARTTGPCYTANAGCSSSVRADQQRPDADQQRRVRRDRRDRRRQLPLPAAQEGLRPGQDGPGPGRRRAARTNALPDEPIEFDRLMRPYDRRQGCVNYGEGSVTLILESREHAERRGAAIYGQVLDQAITRDGLATPAGQRPDRRRPRRRGPPAPRRPAGSSRSATCTAAATAAWRTQEAKAIRALFGDRAGDLLMTSQEGCFGHNGAPTGAPGRRADAADDAATARSARPPTASSRWTACPSTRCPAARACRSTSTTR